MGVSETELTATVAELVHIDDKTVETIDDACLDRDLFQGLSEVDKPLIPVVHQQPPWVLRPLPLLLTPSHGYLPPAA